MSYKMLLQNEVLSSAKRWEEYLAVNKIQFVRSLCCSRKLRSFLYPSLALAIVHC